MLEYTAYKNKHGDWKKAIAWLQVYKLPMHEWWGSWGQHSPLLLPIASDMGTIDHAAGGIERNWSAHDFLNSKRRSSTSSNTLSKEVYYYTNSRLRDQRLARGKGKKRKVVCYDENGHEIIYPEIGDRTYQSGDESIGTDNE